MHVLRVRYEVSVNKPRTHDGKSITGWAHLNLFRNEPNLSQVLFRLEKKKESWIVHVYLPRMQAGNVFVASMCQSDCVSVQAIKSF